MTDSKTVSTLKPARIEPGGFRQLGPLNSVIAKIGAKTIRAPRFALLNVLGQHHLLFLTWLPYSCLLLAGASCPAQDAELVILRVGHLRDCSTNCSSTADSPAAAVSTSPRRQRFSKGRTPRDSPISSAY